jgi:predicted phosphoadenosine phosphosulfate sulfurtransferase
MSRQRRYIETDVLTEARKRIARLYDLFDTVVVAFSGGKDSLVVLNLVREFHRANGLGKVQAVFLDEELVPDAVIDFNRRIMLEDWIDLKWLCVPLASSRLCLGEMKAYKQWDTDRPHVRPKPEWAFDAPIRPGEAFSEYKINVLYGRMWKGKIAVCTGIRAAESLIRHSACCSKLVDNWITAPYSPDPEFKLPKNIQNAKPIFDWQENDVFKYFHDEGIEYCPQYDWQMWAGAELRVATPVNSAQAKQTFHLLRTFSPVLYEQTLQLFPEMAAHERYFKQLGTQEEDAEYAKSFEGVREYILTKLEPVQQKRALEVLAMCERSAKRRPEGYPPEYVFKYMKGGSFRRNLMPLRDERYTHK